MPVVIALAFHVMSRRRAKRMQGMVFGVVGWCNHGRMAFVIGWFSLPMRCFEYPILVISCGGRVYYMIVMASKLSLVSQLIDWSGWRLMLPVGETVLSSSWILIANVQIWLLSLDTIALFGNLAGAAELTGSDLIDLIRLWSFLV